MLFKSATSRNIFTAVALGVVTTIGVAGTLVSISYDNIRTASLNEMRAAAQQAAAEIDAGLRDGHRMVSGLEAAITSLRETGSATRENTVALMQKTLEGYPGAIGLSTGWEPNAFDGKDADYVGKPFHDASGRFVPYVFRAGSDIKVEVLVDYDKPGAGDYYQLPVKTGKPVLMEPYVYPVNGKDVLMTTLSLPTRANGAVVGYVGADIDLDKTAADLAAKRPLGDGYIALLSSANAFVSHPDKAVMGKALKESGVDTAAWERALAKPGEAQTIVRPDGTEDLAMALPIVPFEGAVWNVVVSVPSATVYASLTKIVWNSAAIIGLATVLLVVAGWLLARGFIGRINRVIHQTTQIAEGRLDVELTDREKPDELGDLSRSLQILLENNRRKVQLENEAEAHRVQEEIERTERSKGHMAREEEIRFVVTELGNGLARLSDGDMTVRLEKPFSGTLDSDPRRLQRIDRKAAGRHALLPGECLDHPERFERDPLRRRRSRPPHRTAGSLARGDRRGARRDHHLGPRIRPQRAEEAGRMVARTKDGAERSGEVVRNAVDAMSAIEQSSQPDLQHHRRHRRDRLPDQPAGAQRRRRGGPRRRSRQGLCRRRPGSARTGPALGQGRQGNQGADHRLRRPGQHRRRAGRRRPARRCRRSSPRSQQINSQRRRRSSGSAREQSTGLQRDQLRPSTRWTRAPSRTPPWSRRPMPPPTRWCRKSRRFPPVSISSTSAMAAAPRLRCGPHQRQPPRSGRSRQAPPGLHRSPPRPAPSATAWPRRSAPSPRRPPATGKSSEPSGRNTGNCKWRATSPPFFVLRAFGQRALKVGSGKATETLPIRVLRWMAATASSASKASTMPASTSIR